MQPAHAQDGLRTRERFRAPGLASSFPSVIHCIGCIFRPLRNRFAFLILMVLVVGCGKPAASDSTKTEQAASSPVPIPASTAATGPITNWVDLGITTNAIDGTKREHLSLESTDTLLTSVGESSHAEFTLCFEDGRLCREVVAVGVKVHRMVEPLSYESQTDTPIRIRFDDEKPSRQTWSIADSHDALFPFGREEQFLLQLIRHKKLILEFSYYEKAPQTLTFEIYGLDDKLKSIGIDVKTQAAARASATRAREAHEQKQRNADIEAFMAAHTDVDKNIVAQVELCKDKNPPNWFCWNPPDGSAPSGPFQTREIAIRYAMAHYRDHTK